VLKVLDTQGCSELGIQFPLFWFVRSLKAGVSHLMLYGIPSVLVQLVVTFPTEEIAPWGVQFCVRSGKLSLALFHMQGCGLLVVFLSVSFRHITDSLDGVVGVWILKATHCPRKLRHIQLSGVVVLGDSHTTKLVF
jgi:hypothetical protein